MATVQPDLQTIVGTIQVPEEDDLRLEDPIADLPVPQTDLTAQRTWPTGEETGWMRIRPPNRHGIQDFRTLIPRRFGASGKVPGHGLYLNGLWHPQPILGDRIAVTRWDVEVRAPEGAIVVLNSTVGSGVVKWTGMADRLALAVVPGGRATRLDSEIQPLIVIDKGPLKPRRNERLQAMIPENWPLKGGGPIVVVMSPMLRRLTRPGPGMVFLSNHATRLTGQLWQHHTSAVRRGLLAAGLLSPDTWARALAAQHLVDALPPGPNAAQTLSWIAWIPGIDAMLYDGSLPFTSEVMGETWPSDPLRDDLTEIIEDVTPSQAAARKLIGLVGWNQMAEMVTGIMSGEALDSAAKSAGVDENFLAQWRTQPPPQNLALLSRPTPSGGRTITITREAEENAPPEPVQIRIDGVDRSWITAQGPDTTTIDLPTSPRRVEIDPRGHLEQTRRDDDGWPPRWTPTFAGGVSELALRQARPTASAHAWMRRRYGTRWVYGLHLGTDPVDLLSGRASISRSLGPLLDRRSRAYRVWLTTGVSLLDPDFRPTDKGKTAVDTWIGGSWDTKEGWPLPRRGHRIALATGTGWVPQSDQRWTAIGAHTSGLLPLTHWAVLASSARGGVSLGRVAHRLRALGGTGGVQGLPADAVLGHTSAVASVELRTLPIRHASVPLPLAWGTDLQLSAGLDAGTAWQEDGRVHAVGWTAGVAGVADILGARPTLGGIWLARAIPSLTGDMPTDDRPQLYLRFRQPF